ncbi:MAG: OmpA family protein [Bacteroidota bacterium]
MRYLLLILICGLYSLAFPQDSPLLFDTFTESAKDWPLGQYLDYSAHWDSGFVQFQHRSSETTCFTKELFLKDVVRLSIETKIQLSSQSLLNTSGICWSVDPSGERYHAFQIRPEGSFRVISVDDGTEKVWIDWSKNRRIKEVGEANELRIEKEGRSLYGFINDKEVFRLPWQRFNGKYHGLCFQGNGEWNIDYFKVEHPPVIIPLVDAPMRDAASFPLDSMLTDSSRDESAPRVSPDGRTIYFSVSRPSENLSQGQVWYTHFQGDTLWTPPEPLFASASAQRQEVFFINKEHDALWLSGNPYQVKNYRDSSWSKSVLGEIPKLNHSGEPPSYSLTTGKEVMILSLDRSDSYGERDLYVCFKTGDSWSAPKHLGADVNTWGEEITPYLMADNKTLIFASSGRPGYGQVDLYMSVRQSNTWTDWSEPLNLGPGINSKYWDTHYLPLKNPRRAYMAKQDSSGDFDLYTVRIPEDYEALGIARVFGSVRNQKNGALLSSKVSIKALTGDSLAVEVATLSPAQGYQTLLPFGKAYSIYANVLGYFPIVDTLDMRALDRFREVKQDLWVRPLEIGQVIQLREVYFKRAQAEMLAESYPELDRLVLLMQALPKLKIEIQGHTDNIGQPEELQFLSEDRAETVRIYLLDHGIAADRISSQGFGATRPVASNENPATRHLNRRVEFEIISR